jgi:DNA-binding response OmpR family regulator
MAFRLPRRRKMASRWYKTAAWTLFLLSADLSDLQCCNALAEIKGLAATATTRVILLTRGGGVERARALDLGADDVLSPQWEPAELLARVRVQLRDKRAHEDLREKTRIATEGQQIANTAFQAVAVTEKMTRDAITLDRALKNRSRLAYFCRGHHYGDFFGVFATCG